MKFQNKIKLLGILFIVLAATNSLVSQTQEQVKIFVNRSMMAVYQVEKEVLKQSLTNIDADLKKAVKYQAIAVKLYKQNKFEDAVGYAYKARVQANALLQSVNQKAVDYFDFNQEEKSYTDATKYINLSTNNLLSASENKQIDDLNTSKFEEFRAIDLSAPIQ